MLQRWRFAWAWFIGATLVSIGCAQVKPIVHWTCAGCQMLVASGACRYFVTPEGQKVAVPECKTGEVVVVENWKAVSREGAVPVLGCEKQ